MPPEPSVIAAHRAQGREFTAAGVRSFVRETGGGEAVLCVHGIPASSFPYRKLLPVLAERGLRGVAFDPPGPRAGGPPGRVQLQLDGARRVVLRGRRRPRAGALHLVVHDFGGPVGFELCARMPERIRSLTILNTAVDVEHFHRPPALELLARPRLSAALLKLLPRPAFRALMWRVGIADRASTSDAELDAWLDLLRREDGGRACVRMAAGLERTRAKSELYAGAIRALTVPVQILWGVADPILKISEHGEDLRAVTGVSPVHLPGKHFLQEDCFEAIGEHVARLAATARTPVQA